MMNQMAKVAIECSEDVQQVDIQLIPAIETPVTNYFAYFYVADEDFITEEEYPVLAQVWNNDDDAIFDNM